MRITVDVSPEQMEAILLATGESKKGPAIIKAASEFVRRDAINQFTRRALAGEFDYPMTNDEIEAADLADIAEMDRRRHGAD